MLSEGALPAVAEAVRTCLVAGAGVQTHFDLPVFVSDFLPSALVSDSDSDSGCDSACDAASPLFFLWSLLPDSCCGFGFGSGGGWRRHLPVGPSCSLSSRFSFWKRPHFETYFWTFFSTYFWTSFVHPPPCPSLCPYASPSASRYLAPSRLS
mmetsp:Transcript_56449/g.123380  ORF Transcript_56449/g.123380 Transcript_56449/m.123380 type:complete len:152 (+) Transcript_56449:489-944(+)